MIKKHQKNAPYSVKKAAKHQNTKITVDELLEKVGVCQRLGYGSGCECLNECFIIRQHLDTKEY